MEGEGEEGEGVEVEVAEAVVVKFVLRSHVCCRAS